MAATTVASIPSKKLPRPGRGGFEPHSLSEEEAPVRAIVEIVSSMVDLSRHGETVDLNALKSAACHKYGLERAPKLVEMIVAVMSKPHRCPHIATIRNICVYCPGGPNSDFEYNT